MTAQLIAPTVRLHRQWLDARDDWGRDVHQDGSGLSAGDDVDSAAGFAAFVDRLLGLAEHAPEGLVTCTFRWIVADDVVLGTVALRHELNDFLLRAGGHIGYGVRPAARGRGLARFALGEMLVVARGRGLDRVLLTCNVANEASRRVIESYGGVLEDIRDTEIGRVRRYWIAV